MNRRHSPRELVQLKGVCHVASFEGGSGGIGERYPGLL